MAPDQSTKAEMMETQSPTIGGRSMDAIERGAIRRRMAFGGRGPNPANAEAADGQSSPGSAESPQARLDPRRRRLLSPGTPAGSSAAQRAAELHGTEPTYIEGELAALRRAIAGLKTELAQDRETVRVAVAEMATFRGDSLDCIEELDRLQTQVQELEEWVRAEAERAQDRQEEPSRIDPGVVDSDIHEPVVDRLVEEQASLAEEQASLADAVAALSRDLVAQRMRTTGIIFVGVAAAMIFLAVWFFVGGPGL